MPSSRFPTRCSDTNVGAVDTLIGDITPPETLMKTLTDRKLAEQEKVTYDTQRLAELKRGKELQKAEPEADTQVKTSSPQGNCKVEIRRSSTRNRW